MMTNLIILNIFMLNKLLRRIEKWFGRNHLRQLSDGKASYIKKFVLASQNIPGELAEVGVSIGDSASIICENKEHRPLHLFDTFTGHPEEWIGRYDIGQTAGRHAATMESVQERLKRYPNVHFYQGIFPVKQMLHARHSRHRRSGAAAWFALFL